MIVMVHGRGVVFLDELRYYSFFSDRAHVVYYNKALNIMNT